MGVVELGEEGGPVHPVEHPGRPFEHLRQPPLPELHRVGSEGIGNIVPVLGTEVDPRLFKIRNDPRVTRVGKWLRKWSLDELPQLWNVLRGQMSLVGPRPCLATEMALYQDWHHGRLEVPPGITGLWQVSGRSDLSFDDYVRRDLFYIENWSLTYDLFIIAKTFPAVVLGRGAF